MAKILHVHMRTAGQLADIQQGDDVMEPEIEIPITRDTRSVRRRTPDYKIRPSRSVNDA